MVVDVSTSACSFSGPVPPFSRRINLPGTLKSAWANSFRALKSPWITWLINIACIGGFWFTVIPTFFHPQGILSSWQLGGYCFFAILLFVNESSRRAELKQQPLPQSAQLQAAWRVSSIYVLTLLLNTVGLAVLLPHLGAISTFDWITYDAIAIGVILSGLRVRFSQHEGTLRLEFKYEFDLKSKATQGRLALVMRAVPQTALGVSMLMAGRPTMELSTIAIMLALGFLRLIVVWPAFRAAAGSVQRPGLRATLVAELGNFASVGVILGCWMQETLTYLH